MRLNRFFINKSLKAGNIIVSDTDFINQAKNVLRLKIGDKLILCDGNLNEAVAEITSLNKELAELKILETYKNENESENYVNLYCSILKKENFEWAVQKAVEVGVKEIIPIITARTVKLGLNHERLNKIIKEAAEQSGRGVMPRLNEAVAFDEAVKQAKNANDLNFFFQAGYPPLGHSMSKFKKIGVFVGPEGGWDEKEISAVTALEIPSLAPNENGFSLDGSLGIIKKSQSNGFTVVGLGKTVLRAETAAILACYVAMSFFKENAHWSPSSLK